MPKVSIVMPVYNGEKYLRQSLTSIIEQTFQDWELIIVNDCSSDSSLQIMKEFRSKDKRIKIVNNEVNQKLPKSLNIGFKYATGQYWTWTSDDNLYDINCISKMTKYLDDNDNIGLVCTDEYFIDDRGRILLEKKRDAADFFIRNCVGASFMYRASVANTVGEYDPLMFLVEDYDYWLRIKRVTEVGYIHELLYYYRMHSQSLTSTKRKSIQDVLYKLREKNLDFMLDNMDLERKKILYYEMMMVDKEKTITYKDKFFDRNEQSCVRWMEKERNMEDNRSIILFGAGVCGDVAIEIIGKEKVYCYADNNSDIVGEKKNGKKIISFEELTKIYKDYKIVISVTPSTAIHIAYQLQNAGINEFETYIEYLNGKKNPSKTGSDIDWIKAVNMAGKWILNNTVEGKGIIDTTESMKAYPEVSGYYIPTLIEWGYKSVAIQYAKWLCENQHEDGSWYDAKDEKPYVFDTAQILKGLIRIRKILPEVESHIIRGCDWMISNIDEEGRLFPVTPIWGGEEGICSELIHLYCLSPLMEAGKIYDMRYYDAAEKSVSYYINNFKEDILDFNILSHFYGYVMEALCDIGEKELAREAMDKLGLVQKEDGAIPAYKDVDFVCSTGMFQLAIVWYKLGEKEKADRALTYATRLQNESGGWYGSYAVQENVVVTDKKGFPTYLPAEEISWAVKYFLDAVSLKMKSEFDEQADSFESVVKKEDGRYINLKKEIQDGYKICDVGCGKGRFAKSLKEDFKELNITCVDLSTKVMEYIDVDVEKKQGSLTCIPEETGTFDVAYTIEALEHTIIPENALEELYRIVKPGGKIIVIDKTKSTQQKMLIDEWEQYFDDSLFEKFSEKHGCGLSITKEFDGFEPEFFGMWVLQK